MLVKKVSDTELNITVTNTDGNKEIAVLLRALFQYSEKCKLMRNVSGSAAEKTQLTLDGPIARDMVKALYSVD